MAGYWLKLYTEILDDPKYFRLSDNAKLGMVELMIVAKRADLDGEVPCIEDIAFYTRRSVDWWLPVFEELSKIDYLVKNGSATIIRTFAERQAKVEDAERMRQARALKHKKEFMSRDGYDDVTKRNGDSDTETDSDTDTEVCGGALNREHHNAIEKDNSFLLDNIFMGVTTFYPSKKNADETQRAITLICERKGIKITAGNSEKIKDVLRPFFLDWCRRKGKNGNPYSRTNITWLTEWAVLDEIPPESNGKPKSKTDTIAEKNAAVIAEFLAKQEVVDG